MTRQHSGSRRSARVAVVLAALLGVVVASCAKDETTAPPQTPTAGQMQARTFQFAPPDDTEFIRTERRTMEYSIVGTPLRRLDEEELKWRVEVDREGSQYLVKQDLVGIAFMRNGETLARAEVPKGAISAELVIDRNGNLLNVRGLEKTAATLQSLAEPGSEALAEAVFSPQRLSDMVATRYKLLVGDLVGRPANPGASWTVTSPPGSVLKSRKITVERLEPCGAATCAVMRVDMELDASIVHDAAVALVGRRVAELGGDPASVKVTSSTHKMSGSQRMDPATMLSHGAALAESGSVKVAGPREELTVALKGTTSFSYEYRGGAVAVTER